MVKVVEHEDELLWNLNENRKEGNDPLDNENEDLLCLHCFLLTFCYFDVLNFMKMRLSVVYDIMIMRQMIFLSI